MTDGPVRADELFRLVDELLTPHDGPGLVEKAPFLIYDFNFEAGSVDAAWLMEPDDPDSADELWLSDGWRRASSTCATGSGSPEDVWTRTHGPTRARAADRRYAAAWPR